MISRRTRLQDKKSTRRGIFFLLLSIGMVVGVFFYGLPVLAQFTSLILDFKGSAKPSQAIDETAPEPPIFFNTGDTATQERLFRLEGRAESSATLEIFVNDNKSKELQVPDTETFNVDLELEEGENLIWARAVDTAGNTSKESYKITVLYDSEAPELEVIQPQNGAVFTGEKSITIKGKTEKSARVTVNERLAIVSNVGEFSQKVNLSEGNNVIIIVSEDEGGNVAELQLAVTYQP